MLLWRGGNLTASSALLVAERQSALYQPLRRLLASSLTSAPPTAVAVTHHKKDKVCRWFKQQCTEIEPNLPAGSAWDQPFSPAEGARLLKATIVLLLVELMAKLLLLPGPGGDL
jgi:hypothetical protein